MTDDINVGCGHLWRSRLPLYGATLPHVCCAHDAATDECVCTCGARRSKAERILDPRDDQPTDPQLVHVASGTPSEVIAEWDRLVREDEQPH